MPGLVHAGHDVLGDRHGRRHDVDVGLEAAADHAQRVGDAVLAVHREVPRHDVDDLMVLGDLDAPGRVDDPGDVLLGDLPVLAGHGHDAPAVEGPDVGARNAHPGARNLHAGHDLGLFGGPLDRLDRGVDVDDVALAGAAVGRGALADDVEGAAGVLLADQDADLGGADVAGDEEVFGLSHGDSGAGSREAGTGDGAESGSAVSVSASHPPLETVPRAVRADENDAIGKTEIDGPRLPPATLNETARLEQRANLLRSVGPKNANRPSERSHPSYRIRRPGARRFPRARRSSRAAPRAGPRAVPRPRAACADRR